MNISSNSPSPDSPSPDSPSPSNPVTKKRYSPEEEANLTPLSPGKRLIHNIIFGYESFAGKLFDVLLFVAIILSILVVMLESVKEFNAKWGDILRILEWTLTILFTVEYGLRLYCVARPRSYAFSFFGIVDLLSILPTYLALYFVTSSSLGIIRVLRLLRIFRVLKLTHYIKEANHLWTAFLETRRKITVFIFVVMSLVLILGSLMYIIEGEENGFTSIPRSVYWAIVTVTTVGYGDIAPQTPLGQTLAAVTMLLGYSMIIVPTGVFTAEVAAAQSKHVQNESTDPLADELTNKLAESQSNHCLVCEKGGHASDAVFCKYCGNRLD